MIIKEYIKTTWNAANKEHLIKKGYKFSNFREEVEILSTDISPTSAIKVKFKCQNCGCVFTRQRRKVDINKKCLCESCNRKINREQKRKKCNCGNFITRPKDNDYCELCKKEKIKNQYSRNDYEYINKNTVKIFLRNNKQQVTGFTLIDAKNLDKVIKHKWRLYGGYAVGGPDCNTKMHRFIMDTSLEVDHINHNTIDNRENNLRVVTHKENCSNRRKVGSMRYAAIKLNDIANGPAIRVSFWLQGCDLMCKGCHNYKIWDFNGGKTYTNKTFEEVKKYLDENNYIQRNFSILGGEPLHEKNIDTTLDFIQKIKIYYPEASIYLWTGYSYENINHEKTKYILHYIDVLIDGKFEEDKKDLSLKYCGSTNQRVINMKETIKQEKIILL